ncbi:LysE family translocator [Haloarchaeobius sp. DYHT-AS-18]|uniref:LysE family translocator n=1 Tax=Haloarchaeobius sp. DYHT-AS-18 TaxID=3446117 RepID=UPI003EB6A6A7
MLAVSTLLAFVPAALAIVLAPGPDTMVVLARGLGEGRRAGLAAACGTATGVLLHTLAAVAGLSVVLQTSAFAYRLVTYVGAAYLVYLGVQTLRDDEEFAVSAEAVPADSSPLRAFRQALAVNVSNPKVAVFVLAFLPQFVPAGTDAPGEMLLLGVVYAALGLVYLGLLAVFASQARRVVARSERLPRVLRAVSGTVLVGFAALLVLDGHHG